MRRVHHRDDGLRAFEREPFLPNVFGLQERLERLGRIQLGQDVLLLRDSRLVVLDLDPLLQPLLLFGLEDVGVLHADVAAVRVAQQAEHLAQLLVLGAAEAVDLELAVQVPQRQAMRVHIEVGVAAEAGLVQPQRVDVGHQMAAVPVGRDQLEDAAVLVLDRVGVVGAPAHRLVRDTQFAEDLVEEVVRQQKFVDGAQEVAGLRALDDAMVVGGGEGDQLADAQLGDAFLTGALELGWVLHRADADDRALPAHQPRHRVHGADGARVGQRDRHAGKVFGGQLAVAGAPHDVLVAGDELAEPHCLATLDGGDYELAVAVLALKVDREAEVDVRGRDRVRLAVHFREVAVHVRELLDRLHQRVADQMREGDLAAARALEVVVDDDRGCRTSAWPGWPARWSRSARRATPTCSSRRRPQRRAAQAPLRLRRACAGREASALPRPSPASGALAGAAASAFGAGAGAGSGGAVGRGRPAAGCPLPAVDCASAVGSGE